MSAGLCYLPAERRPQLGDPPVTRALRRRRATRSQRQEDRRPEQCDIGHGSR